MVEEASEKQISANKNSIENGHKVWFIQLYFLYLQLTETKLEPTIGIKGKL